MLNSLVTKINYTNKDKLLGSVIASHISKSPYKRKYKAQTITIAIKNEDQMLFGDAISGSDYMKYEDKQALLNKINQYNVPHSKLYERTLIKLNDKIQLSRLSASRSRREYRRSPPRM